MKQIKKILSAYKRKVHIDEQEWTYQITHNYSKGFVKVCSPDRKKKWNLEVGQLGHNHCACCGYYHDEPDETWKPLWNPMTPAHVKRLIEKRILRRKIPR